MNCLPARNISKEPNIGKKYLILATLPRKINNIFQSIPILKLNYIKTNIENQLHGGEKDRQPAHKASICIIYQKINT